MRARAVVPVAFAALGVALVAVAVARGDATAGLIVIVPFVTGSSAVFLGGLLALIGAFVTLPLAFTPDEDRAEVDVPATPPSSGIGGVVVIGPIPIFFGRWRSVSRTAKILVAVAGAAILAVLVLALTGLLR